MNKRNTQKISISRRKKTRKLQRGAGGCIGRLCSSNKNLRISPAPSPKRYAAEGNERAVANERAALEQGRLFRLEEQRVNEWRRNPERNEENRRSASLGQLRAKNRSINTNKLASMRNKLPLVAGLISSMGYGAEAKPLRHVAGELYRKNEKTQELAKMLHYGINLYNRTKSVPRTL